MRCQQKSSELFWSRGEKLVAVQTGVSVWKTLIETLGQDIEEDTVRFHSPRPVTAGAEELSLFVKQSSYHCFFHTQTSRQRQR